MDTQSCVIPAGLTPGLDSAAVSLAEGTPSWRSGVSPSPTPRTGNGNPNTPLPLPSNVVPRSLTERESQLVKHLSRLQFFLATAPTRWTGPDENSLPATVGAPARHPNLNRFPLLNGEYVSCVFWNGLYHITGTDIVRALVFRFEAFSRPVQNMKKFEEGVFSDLRNLKPGTDACLEEPKSPFLDLLFRNACIRTQKKQKVFYWFSVPHDRLFLDALERDLKREKANLEPTTGVLGEPARSFRYDPTRGLYEQFAGKQPGLDDTDGPPSAVSDQSCPPILPFGNTHPGSALAIKAEADAESPTSRPAGEDMMSAAGDDGAYSDTATSVLFSRSLLKGSPSYKQRRKKASLGKRQRSSRASTAGSQYDSGNEDSGSDGDIAPHGAYHLSSSSMGVQDPRNQHIALISDPLLPQQPSSILLLQTGGSLAWTSTPMRGLSTFNERTPEEISSASSLPVEIDIQADRTRAGQAVTTSPLASNKGFSCPLLSCGRLFKRLEHLKRHVRTHTQERPYECARCSKRFSRSDNLTQHVKTHEKADRGERMKTEASETTEDEVVKYLEAEVDAMAARDIRTFGLSTDGIGARDTYIGQQGLHATHPSRPLGVQGLTYMGSPQNSAALPQYGLQDISWSPSAEPRWSGARDGHAPPIDQLHSNILKRHSRSMTPNVAPPRSVLSSGPGARFHPYHLPSLAEAPHHAPSGHRSSSVDSFQLPVRMTAAPTHQLLPDILNNPTSQGIFRQGSSIRQPYQSHTQGPAQSAVLFNPMGMNSTNLVSGGEDTAATDAVAEASGFAEWANGSV